MKDHDLQDIPPELRNQLTRSATKPRPADEPMCYASGYSLDLYCDHVNPRHGYAEFPHTFTGETFAECARPARKRGWRFHYKSRTATCPKCTGAR